METILTQTGKAKSQRTGLAGTLFKYRSQKYLFIMLLPVLAYYAIFHYGPI